MVYKNKARDMKRAPLPSRADKMARGKKRLARKDSRRHGKKISNMAKTHGWDEAFDRFDPNWDNQHGPGWARATRDIVRERRYADNLGALMRWAEDLAKKNPDLPPDALRLKVREIIGWDYMADHLMSHVENIEAFDINPVRSRWWRRYNYDNSYENDVLIPKLVAHCQDLWLRGQNRELHKISYKIQAHRARPNWERHTYREPIYKWDRNYRKQIFTGQYKDVEYWTRKILSYAEIEEVVREWIAVNRSTLYHLVK